MKISKVTDEVLVCCLVSLAIISVVLCVAGAVMTACMVVEILATM